DRQGLDDRAVAAKRDVAERAATRGDDGFRVDCSKPCRQIGRKLAVNRCITRHCDRYSEHNGMGQVTINSQCLPLKVRESARRWLDPPENRVTLTDAVRASQPWGFPPGPEQAGDRPIARTRSELEDRSAGG